MTVRPIDANIAMKKIREYMEDFPNASTRLATCRSIISMLGDENQIPTLTHPNETPPCYQPDGDGCAYQCYDGDDEPIDKCKECPLCYSDKQRHRTTLNEPLTLEELWLCNDPVWIKRIAGQDLSGDGWAIVEGPRCSTWINGIPMSWEIKVWWPGSEAPDYPKPEDYGKIWFAYRRPPEGEGGDVGRG